MSQADQILRDLRAGNADVLRGILDYDENTGLFRWRKPAGSRGRIPAGTVAGHASAPHGYIQIRLAGRLWYGHRLAWLYVTGEWPSAEIDHINNNPGDNRWANLREATRLQQLHNIRRMAKNRTGVKGVSWDPTKNKWHARIKNDGQLHHLGYFESFAEAVRVRTAATHELHGEFARLA